MKSDLNLPPIHDAVDVTSRHFRRCHVTSRPRTLHRASGRRCRTRHLEHLPEIKIRKASEIHFKFKFEIAFFIKTDEFKSAFKLRLTSPGRKLLPFLVLLYFSNPTN